MTDETATDADFRRRLDEAASATEATLDALLGTQPLAGEIARPARLMEAMRYVALGGGKRLRPFLALESARLFGVEGEGARRAAAAIEMIHCYSLAHDDLPAMDDDDLRRAARLRTRPSTRRPPFSPATGC